MCNDASTARSAVRTSIGVTGRSHRARAAAGEVTAPAPDMAAVRKTPIMPARLMHRWSTRLKPEKAKLSIVSSSRQAQPSKGGRQSGAAAAPEAPVTRRKMSKIWASGRPMTSRARCANRIARHRARRDGALRASTTSSSTSTSSESESANETAKRRQGSLGGAIEAARSG
eukprot:scaffold250451_cov26-Tisochrysis_lutea.AAC.1